MEQTTSIQYTALNEKSYETLAAYAVTLNATVTLYPKLQVIVITDNVAGEVKKYIDKRGLDFGINPIILHDECFGDMIDNPTTDSNTLRKIIYHLLEARKSMATDHQDALDEITKQKDATAKDLDMYKKLYYETSGRESRIKEQVKAIAVLMDSIFPKD